MATHGLFIGINNYPGTDLDLAGCVNDAHDWQAACRPMLWSSTTLIDAAATRERIMSELALLLARLSAGDWAVITFSGHGTWVPDENGDEPDGRDEALVPHDFNNLILDDEIHEQLVRRRPGSRVLLVTDACHSGTVFRLFKPPHVATRLRFLPPELLARFSEAAPVTQTHQRRSLAERIARRVLLPRQKALPGVVHLAGCSDHEYCYDATINGRDCGSFSHAALQALARLSSPSFNSSFGTWHAAIRRELPSHEFPQTPQLNALAADKRLTVPLIKAR